MKKKEEEKDWRSRKIDESKITQRDLERYEEILEKLASENSSVIFTNKDLGHCLIVVDYLFSISKEAKIYCSLEDFEEIFSPIIRRHPNVSVTFKVNKGDYESFSIYDREKFRLEINDKHGAICSFNSEAYCAFLLEFFNEL